MNENVNRIIKNYTRLCKTVHVVYGLKQHIREYLLLGNKRAKVINSIACGTHSGYKCILHTSMTSVADIKRL